MKYLVDTSALVRILRLEVDPVWDDVVERGLVSVCEPAVHEDRDFETVGRFVPELRQHLISAGPGVANA